MPKNSKNVATHYLCQYQHTCLINNLLECHKEIKLKLHRKRVAKPIIYLKIKLKTQLLIPNIHY